MKKFLDRCLILILLGSLICCGYYVYKNPAVLDRFFKEDPPEAICTVSFECNGGSVFDAQSVENGGTIEEWNARDIEVNVNYEVKHQNKTTLSLLIEHNFTFHSSNRLYCLSFDKT